MILQPSLAEKHQIMLFGCFDGVHCGHQALFMHAKNRAAIYHTSVVAFLFFPHTAHYLGKDIGVLQTLEQRCQVIQKIGVSPYVLPFDGVIASMDADTFVTQVLSIYQPLEIVIGENARFGRNRTGDISLIQKYFPVSSVPLIHNREVISSSRIRACIQKGDLELACELLGRPLTFKGIVQHGQKIGRTLGFPTINLLIDDYVKLPYGVYHGIVHVRHQKFSAVINFGIRPTVGKGKEILEAFLFDFCQEVYGEIVDIQIFGFLRSEKKFDSLYLLKKQMIEDANTAKERNMRYAL